MRSMAEDWVGRLVSGKKLGLLGYTVGIGLVVQNVGCLVGLVGSVGKRNA